MVTSTRVDLMILMLWIDGYRHDFSTDAALDLVVGAAADGVRRASARERLPFSSSWVAKFVAGHVGLFRVGHEMTDRR
jgi:hypothetical protein